MSERQSFHEVLRVNLAFAECALQHPDSLESINRAWSEYLVGTGWSTDEWLTAVQQMQARGAVPDIASQVQN